MLHPANIDNCACAQVSEFLDDEELPSAICDVARRLTFEWATQSKDTAHENSPEAALDTLRSTLKQRVLALVPIHFVLKHATEEQQATTISETSLVTSAAGVLQSTSLCNRPVPSSLRDKDVCIM